MIIELKVPELGESITEVEIAAWLKQTGEPVGKDEPIVSIDSAKATLEIPAPDAGTLKEIRKQKGQTAAVGETIALLEQDGAAAPPPRPSAAPKAAPKETAPPAPPVQVPIPPPEAAPEPPATEEKPPPTPAKEPPAPQAQAKAHAPSKPVIKDDTMPTATEPRAQMQAPKIIPGEPFREKAEPPLKRPIPATPAGREEEIVPMSRLRRTIAERLVQAKSTAALLTTFNEIDMAAIVALRKEHGEAFQQKHGIKLGFMSFFVKATVEALKTYPVVNAEIRENQIIYHNYYDIGVAIGGGKGLVVPVLRHAERLSFAEIEEGIADFARRAKESKLLPEELEGGTFTITNGGIYGSLLSTPIVNPPQSGVLGLHAIQDRPVALQGTVVIRPMMYVALTYDHRLVDGREAVSFLRRIKDVIETPARLLIEI